MKYSLRRHALLPLAGLLAIGLASCSAAAPETAAGAGEVAEGSTIPQEYQRLVLVGASQGGTLYNWTVAVSQLLNTKLDMETSVQASGTQANALDLDSGVIQFGMTSPGDLIQVSGDPDVIDSTEIRTLWAAFSTPFHLLVAADAGIDTIADLEGRGIVTGVTGSIESEVALVTLECAGVDASSVNVQNMGKTEGAAAFGDGTVDAWSGLGTVPTGAFIEAFDSRRGAKLLPIDGDVADCVAEAIPDLAPATVPGGTYTGQAEEIQTLSQWFYAAVPASMPDEVVTLLAQTIADNHDELVAALPAAADSTAENTASFPGFELHPATVAVLEGLGVEGGQ